jgi:hypothetical protein
LKINSTKELSKYLKINDQLLFFLEDGFGYEKERKLFTNYEITRDEPSNSKKKVYFLKKYSEFDQGLRCFCFFPVFYVRKRSILKLEYIQNLPRFSKNLFIVIARK